MMFTVATAMFAETAVYAADANDIAGMFKENSPSGEELNMLLSLKTGDGVEAKDFTDAPLIHRLYRIKNDGDLKRSMFSDYSGNFERELDTETVTWHIPVMDNGNVVSEYLYDDSQEVLLETEHSDVKNDIGFATIYDCDKIANIINSANIGEPTDIKSAYITFPNNAFFMYVKTIKGEYIIPTLPIKLRYYDENEKYIDKTAFDALKVYPAGELAEAYKAALENRERYESEIEERGNNKPNTYLDDNGDIAKTEPKPTDKPQPTAAPEATPAPTAKPEESPKPSPSQTSTPTPAPEPKILKVNGVDMSISVNGKAVDFPDAKPFIDENNRTQIPIRAIMESLGASVDWNDAEQLVTINGNNVNILLTIGSDIINVNGKPTKMDTAAMAIEDRTYIPVRYVAEAMGYEVKFE